MQNDTSLYEMPADRMVFTHERLGAGRELGEVEIVHTIWGNARVRVVNKQGKSGLAWLLAALGVLAAIAILWHLFDKPETNSSEPQVLAAPPISAPQAPAEPPQAQVIPDSPLAPEPQVPAAAHAADTAKITAPEPAKPTQVDTEKARTAADTQPTTVPQRKKAASKEAHIQAQSSSSAKPGKLQPPSGSSPVKTASPDAHAKQPENRETSAIQPAPANAATTAPAGTDQTSSTPPVKAEAAKSDATDSQP